MKENKGVFVLATLLSLVIATLSGCYLFETATASAITTFEWEISSVTVAVGETVQTRLNIEPTDQKNSASIEYSTNTEGIITYVGTNNAMFITGVANGYVTLKAQVTNGGPSTTLLIKCGNGTGTDPGEAKFIECDSNIIDFAPGVESYVNAQLVNGEITEQSQLSWSVLDPTVLSILGSGKTVLVTPLRAGVTTITITHPDAIAPFIITCRVQTTTTYITLSRSTLFLSKNESYEVVAHVTTNGTFDESTIMWSVDTPSNEVQFVSLLANGANCTVTALKAGTVKLKAMIPSGQYAICNIQVDETRKFRIFNNSLTVQPLTVTNIPYELAPINDTLEIIVVDNSVCGATIDTTNKMIVVSTKALEGTTSIIVQTTDGALYDTIIVVNRWIRTFTLSANEDTREPLGTRVITYTVNPPFESVGVNSSNSSIVGATVDNTAKTITIIPTGIEGSATLQFTASGITSNVYANYNYIKELEISGTQVTGQPNQSAQTFTFTQKPSIWTSTVATTDSNVAGVSINNTDKTITVSPTGEGSATITITGSGITRYINVSLGYPDSVVSANVSASVSKEKIIPAKASGDTAWRSARMAIGTDIDFASGDVLFSWGVGGLSGLKNISYAVSITDIANGGTIRASAVGTNAVRIQYRQPLSLTNDRLNVGSVTVVVYHNSTAVWTTSYNAYRNLQNAYADSWSD